jgi:hypothetical protein
MKKILIGLGFFSLLIISCAATGPTPVSDAKNFLKYIIVKQSATASKIDAVDTFVLKNHIFINATTGDTLCSFEKMKDYVHDAVIAGAATFGADSVYSTLTILDKVLFSSSANWIKKVSGQNKLSLKVNNSNEAYLSKPTFSSWPQWENTIISYLGMAKGGVQAIFTADTSYRAAADSMTALSRSAIMKLILKNNSVLDLSAYSSSNKVSITSSNVNGVKLNSNNSSILVDNYGVLVDLPTQTGSYTNTYKIYSPSRDYMYIYKDYLGTNYFWLHGLLGNWYANFNTTHGITYSGMSNSSLISTSLVPKSYADSLNTMLTASGGIVREGNDFHLDLPDEASFYMLAGGTSSGFQYNGRLQLYTTGFGYYGINFSADSLYDRYPKTGIWSGGGNTALYLRGHNGVDIQGNTWIEDLAGSGDAYIQADQYGKLKRGSGGTGGEVDTNGTPAAQSLAIFATPSKIGGNANLWYNGTSLLNGASNAAYAFGSTVNRIYYSGSSIGIVFGDAPIAYFDGTGMFVNGKLKASNIASVDSGFIISSPDGSIKRTNAIRYSTNSDTIDVFKKTKFRGDLYMDKIKRGYPCFLKITSTGIVYADSIGWGAHGGGGMYVGPLQTTESFGTVKYDGGGNRFEVYCYDVNGDRSLNELIDAVAFARLYPNTYIQVAGGTYSFAGNLAFNLSNAWTEVHGNNTYLELPSGFNGSAISITTTGDLSRLKISNLTFRETATRYNLWNGIKLTSSSGTDIEMCRFSDLAFRYCNRGVYVVLQGTGWINANNFSDLNLQAPNVGVKVIRDNTSSTSFFDQNIFSNMQLQCGSNTTVGIDTLSGFGDVFENFQMYDAVSGCKGIKFGPYSTACVLTGCLDWNGYTDLGTENYVRASYVTASNEEVEQNYVTISDFLKLKPRASAPTASEGKCYAGTDHHLYYYNGSTWKQLDN